VSFWRIGNQVSPLLSSCLLLLSIVDEDESCRKYKSKQINFISKNIDLRGSNGTGSPHKVREKCMKALLETFASDFFGKRTVF
jgi:hypothetical protein